MRGKYTILFFILTFCFILPDDAFGQYGKKKKRRPTDEPIESPAEKIFNKMWFGLNVGNPGISNYYFSLGLGPMAAYKLNRTFSAGLISDFNYTYVWNRGGSGENYLDYSFGVFSRAKFFQNFYAHVEYNYTSLDRLNTIDPRTNFPVLFIGGGYTSGRPPWGFEATLLFDTLGNLSVNRIPFVYRLGITYQF